MVNNTYQRQIGSIAYLAAGIMPILKYILPIKIEREWDLLIRFPP